MTPNVFQEFYNRAVTQVQTVVRDTKTAAIVIFVGGFLTGRVLH